jgi:hypothetical protein
MSLLDAVHGVQTIVRGLPGIKAAPDAPPEDITVFPFGITYPSSADGLFQSAGWAKTVHTLYCEIHVARTMLPLAVETAIPYYELFLAALIADPKIGGTVDTVVGLRYLFGRLQYAGVETIGFRFELDVKIQTTT